MSAKYRHIHEPEKSFHSEEKRSTARSLSAWQLVVVASVVLLIVGVLWLKNRPAMFETVDAKLHPTLSAHTGLTTVATLQPATATPTAITVLTDAAAVTGGRALAPRVGELPEAHLDRMLEEGRPIFVFFHSNTCYQCTEMAKIVDQVYPDFAGYVSLVDVNVYDDVNRSLLQRAGIQVIPTLIFIDDTGQGEGTTGIMSVEQLQEKLAGLAAGEMP